jgi:hypothetical protein
VGVVVRVKLVAVPLGSCGGNNRYVGFEKLDIVKEILDTRNDLSAVTCVGNFI